ncbi:MAG: RHS repeat-associated core domain-containing protein, partial [Bacteroidota bacterium]
MTIGSNAYCYDQNGNMRRRTIAGGVYTLTYDAENRLTGMSGNVTASYVYDGDGNRVKETIAGVTRVFVGNHYEVDNGVVKKYYYAGATRVAENSGGALTYLLGDHLGSQALTLDSSGNRLNTNTEIRYYAYGAMRYTAGSTPTTFNFTGQRRDSGSGLLFYNARWYDPAVGRFLQADTIVPEPGNPQALNRYAYVQNNPLRFSDPTGMFSADEICTYFVDCGTDK